jgi:hypothetical protein
VSVSSMTIACQPRRHRDRRNGGEGSSGFTVWAIGDEDQDEDRHET